MRRVQPPSRDRRASLLRLRSILWRCSCQPQIDSSWWPDSALAPVDPTSTCPNSNPNGCYTINYTVSKVLPDLSISKTDSPDPVDVGENLNYTVTVTNNTSGTAAGGVSLTDNLPSGVTFESATPSQGSCAQASGTVTCDLGSLRGANADAAAYALGAASSLALATLLVTAALASAVDLVRRRRHP